MSEAGDSSRPRTRCRWLLAFPICGMVVLFSLSSLQPAELAIVQRIPVSDKWLHSIAYFVLSMSYLPWGAAFKVAGSWRWRRAPLCDWLPFAITTSITFALTDEFHQRFVDGRTPDLADIAADVIGILAAALVCGAPWRRQSRRRILM